MSYRVAPDWKDVAKKLSPNQKSTVLEISLFSYPDIVVASYEAVKLERIWGIRWGVFIDDKGDIQCWANAIKSNMADDSDA